MKMAELGSKAIVELVMTGTAPKPSDGLDFLQHRVTLVTDQPAEGCRLDRHD